jgi:hypothetical protein
MKRSFGDPRLADRTVEIADERARRLIARHGLEIVKGVVAADGDPVTHTFIAYLDGSTESSPGITYGLDRPLAGDVVFVVKGPLTGRRWLWDIVSRERTEVAGGAAGGASNLDGGTPSSVYGGTTAIDGGAP